MINFNPIYKFFGFDPQHSSRYLSSAGWSFLEKIIRLTVGLPVFVIVSRHLGAGDYGILCFALSCAMLVGPLVMLANDAVLARDVLHNPSQSWKILETGLVLRGIGYLLSLGGIVLFLCCSSYGALVKCVVFTCALSNIMTVFMLSDSFFQAHVNTRTSSLFLIAQVLGGSLLKIVLVLLNAPLIWFAVAVLADAVFLAIANLCALKMVFGRWLRWVWDPAYMSRIFTSSWPIALAAVFSVLSARMDQVVILHFWGSSMLGNYGMAVTIFEIWFFIPLALTGAVFPFVVDVTSTSIEFREDRFKKMFSFLFYAGLAIVGINYLFFPWFFKSFLADKFIFGMLFYLYMIFGIPFIFLRYGVDRILVANRREFDIVLCYGGAFLVSVLGLLFFVQRHSLEGWIIFKVLVQAGLGFFTLPLLPSTRGIFQLIKDGILLRWVK